MIGDDNKNKPIFLISIGLVITYIVAVMASTPPLVGISLGNNEAIRVFPQVAYPFSIHQYRDYDARLFSYAITFGGPLGIPLIQSELMDDQSEFILFQSYTTGLTLGLILLVGMVCLVAVLVLLDRMKIIHPKKERIPPVQVLIAFQLLLIVYLLPLLGSLYPWGGAAVLFVTLFPIIAELQEE
jgi:hypothetical protein